MKQVVKTAVVLSIAMILVLGGFVLTFGFIIPSTAKAATYTPVGPYPVVRIRQTNTTGECHKCSVASVEGYLIGSFQYNGMSRTYSGAGTDVDVGDDPIWNYMIDKNYTPASYASLKNLPIPLYHKSVSSRDGLASVIYELLKSGTPVSIYSSSGSNHASVVISYNGNSDSLSLYDFTIMEIKFDSGKYWPNNSTLYSQYAASPQPSNAAQSCYVSLGSWLDNGSKGPTYHLVYGTQSNTSIFDPVVFNAEFYKDANSDLSSMNESELRNHWMNHGIAEGRCASPVFNAPYYLNTHNDLKTAYGTNYSEAISHFVNHGIAEGRQAHEWFNVDIYKANYLDLQQAFGSDNYQYYLHYVNNGYYKKENRLANVRFKLIFDANGGTCTIDQKEITKLAAYGTLPGESETVRAGFVFEGWFTSRDGGLKVTASTQHLSDNEITTVYAHWVEVILDENWTEFTVLPADLDLTDCDIEYNNHYVTTGRTSPGSEWTLCSQGEVQYEAVGGIYESDSELTVSNTRKKVGQYYYHWCGSSMNLANYYQKDYLPTYHSISMSEAGNYTPGEYGNDEGHLNSVLYNSDGSLHYCPTGKSAGWYVKFVYQDFQAYQINTYVRDSGWTDTVEANANSVTYRVRKKQVTSIDFEDAGVYIARGDILVPNMSIEPETAERGSLIWTSNDPAIATVDENGTITAVHIGETYIMASSSKGDISDTLRVSVRTNIDDSSLFVVDGVSVGFFGTGLYGGKMSEYSSQSAVCMVREPGDVLSCTADLTFTNDTEDYIAEFVVTEGNLVTAGNDIYVITKNTARKNVITAHIYETNDDGSKGAEMACANMVIFVVNNDGVLKLPAGLTTLEARAFEGISATVIRLPDHVTLEDNSLAGIPVGTIIYFNSDTITPFLDANVLGSGVDRDPDYYWIDTGTPTTYYLDGNGCATNYFCPGTAVN